MATCKSCGADIKWIRSQRNKMVPVDPVAVTEDHIKHGPLAIQAPGAEFNATVVSHETSLWALAPEDYYLYPLHRCSAPQPAPKKSPLVFACTRR